jgi:hypothetical protein
MTKYRGLVRRTEYVNLFVTATDPEDAEVVVIDDDIDDSQFLEHGDTEIITVEEWE